MTIVRRRRVMPTNNRKDVLTRRVKVRAMIVAGTEDYAIVGFNKKYGGKEEAGDQDLYMHLQQQIFTFDPVSEGIAIVEFEVDVAMKPIDEVHPVGPEAGNE